MKNQVSFTGKALWAFVRQPEKYKGKEVCYSIQVEVTEEQTTKIKAFFQKKLEDAFPDKKFKGDMSIPFKEQKDGVLAVKLRTNLGYTDKMTGDFRPRVVPIFDKYGNELDKSILVGNGSDVQVSGVYKLFYESATKWGVRFYLEAIKVNELVQYGGYGLTFDDAPADGEDSTDASVTADNEADF